MLRNGPKRLCVTAGRHFARADSGLAAGRRVAMEEPSAGCGLVVLNFVEKAEDGALLRAAGERVTKRLYVRSRTSLLRATLMAAPAWLRLLLLSLSLSPLVLYCFACCSRLRLPGVGTSASVETGLDRLGG